MNTKLKVAVVDDDADFGSMLCLLLNHQGFLADQYLSAPEALVQFKKSSPDILLTDYKMGEMDGLTLLQKVQALYPHTIPIMMTAFQSIEMAVEAMKSGAFHYLPKPLKQDDVFIQLNRAREEVFLRQTKVLSNPQKIISPPDLIGVSEAMKSLYTLVQQAAKASANVMIIGENGSGKEMVAKTLHHLSHRKNKPFIPINCAAIPENLLESELFGYVKGSFTGAAADRKGLLEEAHGGTFFLDEIGDMSLPLQAKLLRVLQERKIRPVGSNQFKDIDVRIISATHRNLKSMIAQGLFREDLFYRLNVMPLPVPPLRDRPEDILILADEFLKKFSRRNNSRPKILTPEAQSMFLSYPWPGNVRELENIIERAIVLSHEDQIGTEILIKHVFSESSQIAAPAQIDRPTLEKLEERYIKVVLEQTENKKELASQVLGISRRTLHRKEKQYGLTLKPEQ